MRVDLAHAFVRRRRALGLVALRVGLAALAFVHSYPARKHLAAFVAAPSLGEAWKGIGAAIAVVLYLLPPRLHARALGALWARRRIALVAGGWLFAIAHAVPAADHLPKLASALTWGDAWRGLGALFACAWFTLPLPAQARVLRAAVGAFDPGLWRMAVPRLAAHATLSAVLIFAVASAACGPTDENPLGGPYGGTGRYVGRTAGQSTADTDPADTGAGDGSSAAGPDGSSGRSPSCTGSGSSGAPTPSGDAGASAPTWSSIYASYLGANTTGTCPTCHSGMSSAATAYAWLSRNAQIPGIADPKASRLSWLCGNMPPNGPTSNARGVADLAAWAAAGAKNN